MKIVREALIDTTHFIRGEIETAKYDKTFDINENAVFLPFLQT